NFSLYPNPTADQLQLRWNSTNSFDFVQILNAVGQVVKQVSLVQFQGYIELETNELPSGWYTVQLIGNTGTVAQPMIKE
ncbi:MAG: T9SS type A sorting domain-containing protein, partial [Flavobacteriales bacterium]